MLIVLLSQNWYNKLANITLKQKLDEVDGAVTQLNNDKNQMERKWNVSISTPTDFSSFKSYINATDYYEYVYSSKESVYRKYINNEETVIWRIKSINNEIKSTTVTGTYSFAIHLHKQNNLVFVSITQGAEKFPANTEQNIATIPQEYFPLESVTIIPPDAKQWFVIGKNGDVKLYNRTTEQPYYLSGSSAYIS